MAWEYCTCRATLCLAWPVPFCCVFPSVCPSVCYVRIASKRVNMFSKFFHHLLDLPFCTERYGIPTGTPLTGASNAGPFPFSGVVISTLLCLVAPLRFYCTNVCLIWRFWEINMDGWMDGPVGYEKSRFSTNTNTIQIQIKFILRQGS